MLAVPEQLHLDVPPALDVPLQVHPRVAERGARLRARQRDGLRERRRVADHPQPAPAAAPGRLDEHRVPDPLRDRRPAASRAGFRRNVPAGEHRQPGGDRVLAGG